MAFHPLTSLKKRITRGRSFPTIAKHAGGKFILDPRNWIDNRLAAGVPFETEQLAIAERLVRAHAIDTFIDVGANIGLYTVLLGRLPEIERVIAFEPVRRNFNQLLANVFANRLDAKVEAHRVALSERAMRSTIHIDPNSTGVSRLDLEGCGRNPSVFTESEVIEAVRFDDLCQLSKRRIYMKIDVEGHTAQALAGMTQLFAANTVFVQAEIMNGDAATESLRALGLVVIASVGDDHFFAPAELGIAHA